jgi:hypothetical protein
MKHLYKPEDLLEVYMNGSFTEDAQAEFDRLVREDPSFAEKVTQAVAQRLGSVPEETVNLVSGRLDARIGEIWEKARPSPFAGWLQNSFKAVLALLLLCVVGWGWHYGKTCLQSRITGAKFNTPSADEKQDMALIAKEKGTDQKTSASSPGTASGKPSNEMRVAMNRAAGSEVQKKGSATAQTQPGVQEPAVSPKTTSSSISIQSVSKPGTGTVRTAEGFPLRVSIESPKTQNVALTVLDNNGNLIRHLYQGVWTAGAGYVEWDGKDDGNNMVIAGRYTIVFKAGRKTTSQTVTIQPHLP